MRMIHVVKCRESNKDRDFLTEPSLLRNGVKADLATLAEIRLARSQKIQLAVWEVGRRGVYDVHKTSFA